MRLSNAFSPEARKSKFVSGALAKFSHSLLQGAGFAAKVFDVVLCNCVGCIAYEAADQSDQRVIGQFPKFSSSYSLVRHKSFQHAVEINLRPTCSIVIIIRSNFSRGKYGSKGLCLRLR